MQKCHFEERSDEKSLFRLQGEILIVDKISHIRSKHGFLPEPALSVIPRFLPGPDRVSSPGDILKPLSRQGGRFARNDTSEGVKMTERGVSGEKQVPVRRAGTSLPRAG